jgi:hypothetical protein
MHLLSCILTDVPYICHFGKASGQKDSVIGKHSTTLTAMKQTCKDAGRYHMENIAKQKI